MTGSAAGAGSLGGRVVPAAVCAAGVRRRVRGGASDGGTSFRHGRLVRNGRRDRDGSLVRDEGRDGNGCPDRDGGLGRGGGLGRDRRRDHGRRPELDGRRDGGRRCRGHGSPSGSGLWLLRSQHHLDHRVRADILAAERARRGPAHHRVEAAGAHARRRRGEDREGAGTQDRPEQEPRRAPPIALASDPRRPRPEADSPHETQCKPCDREDVHDGMITRSRRARPNRARGSRIGEQTRIDSPFGSACTVSSPRRSMT